jgi:hypothetical protein
VARVDVTSILCACDALRDFGTRFAALDNAPANVFVTGAPAVASATTPAAAALFSVVAALLLGAWVAGAACGGPRAEAAFAGALRARGAGALVDGAEGGGAFEGGAKVFPEGAVAAAVVPRHLEAVVARLDALRAAQASPAVPAPPAPAPQPTFATLRALAARRLRGGDLGALSALSFFSPRRTFYRPSAHSSPSGGLLAAALFHGLLLTLAATAGLYARVFAAPAARGPAVVSFSPPLAPLSGARFAALVFFSGAVGGACVVALHAALRAAARFRFEARFPALAKELRARAAFAAGVELAARGRWPRDPGAALPLPPGFESESAFSGWLLGGWLWWRRGGSGAAVAPEAPPSPAPPGCTTPRSLLFALDGALERRRAGWGGAANARAATLLGTALPHALTLFCAYYACAFGLRNGADAAGALLGAWAAGLAVWALTLQPAAAFALCWAELTGWGGGALLPLWARAPEPSPSLCSLSAAEAPAAAVAGGSAAGRVHPVEALLEAPLLTAPPLRTLFADGDGGAAAFTMYTALRGGGAVKGARSSDSGGEDPVYAANNTAPAAEGVLPTPSQPPAPAPAPPAAGPPLELAVLRMPPRPLAQPPATPASIGRFSLRPPPAFPSAAAAAAAAALALPPPRRSVSLPLPPTALLPNAARLWEARARFAGTGAAVLAAGRGFPGGPSQAPLYPPFAAGALAVRPRPPLWPRAPGGRLVFTSLWKLGGAALPPRG